MNRQILIVDQSANGHAPCVIYMYDNSFKQINVISENVITAVDETKFIAEYTRHSNASVVIFDGRCLITPAGLVKEYLNDSTYKIIELYPSRRQQPQFRFLTNDEWLDSMIQAYKSYSAVRH